MKTNWYVRKIVQATHKNNCRPKNLIDIKPDGENVGPFLMGNFNIAGIE